MAFQIAVLQFEPVRKNVQENIKRIRSLLQGLQADLVVLPELANGGYLYEIPNELRPYSETRDGKGEFLSAISNIANDLGALIVTGYAENEGDRLFNSAAAVSAKGVIENYQKIHLYNNEKSLFAPGVGGFVVFEWKAVQIGLMICFDWIFPESARTLALKGAQIIAHPANLVLPYCQDAMVTRSIENKVFTITANRIGAEKLKNRKLSFTGCSQITNPKGEILFQGPKNKATVHILSINPEESFDKKISERNDLIDDRKPQFYSV
jgi:predicted amidohydrolase